MDLINIVLTPVNLFVCEVAMYGATFLTYFQTFITDILKTDKLLGFIKKLKKTVEENVDEVKENVKNNIKAVKENIGENIGKITSNVIQNIKNIQALAEDVGQNIKVVQEDVLKNIYGLRDNVKNKITILQEDVIITVGEVLGIINNFIITPAINFYKSLENDVKLFLQTAVRNIRITFTRIINGVNNLFNKVSEYLYEFGKFIVKNVGYISYIYMARFIDNLLPFNLPITVKINLLLGFILLLFVLVLKTVLSSFDNLLIIFIIMPMLFIPMYQGLKQTMPLEKSINQ
jgi:hypothetical protein